MRGIVLAATLVLIVAGPALAADLEDEPPPPPQVAVPYTRPVVRGPYDWTGVYFGANAGYGLGASRWTDLLNPSGVASTGDFKVSGGVFGLTFGVNGQFHNIVFGAESDADFSTMHGSTAPASGFCALPVAPAFNTSTTCQSANNWMFTLRPRLGYAFDRVLFYGTAGVIIANVQARVVGPAIGPAYDSSAQPGWIAGGGVEWAVAGHWSLKIEDLYFQLKNGSCTINCGSEFSVASFAFVPAYDVVKLRANLVRAGLNYKFDWP